MKSMSRVEPIRTFQMDLPHWRQAGTTYFITTRLADSLPEHVIAPWRAKRDEWLLQHEAKRREDLAVEHKLEFDRLFNDTFQALVDAGHGACHLRRRDCADILIGKLIEGHGTCFTLDAWCIMPNHFHALVTPAKRSVMGDIVQHWKGGSSFAINRLLGRSGALWISEPFDHLVRSVAQWRHFGVYIADNPVTAHLQDGFVLGHGAEAGLARDEVLRRVEEGYKREMGEG
jgi:REP element-mobilizing transposase RayT